VFVPKYRKEVLYGKIRKFLGPVFHQLAGQRRSKVLEGHMVQDHVHMLIAIPPKYAVSEAVGYIKGKVRWRLPGNFLVEWMCQHFPGHTAKPLYTAIQRGCSEFCVNGS
jgi:REP element-mobilizing transposase RayT